MKQIMMTCMVDMPEDIFEAAGLTTKVKPAWQGLLDALGKSGVAHSTKLEVLTLDAPRKRPSGGKAPNRAVVLPIAVGDAE